MTNNTKINTFAFDLDGTLYEGEYAINGAVDVCEYLNKKGYNIIYFTNNSSKSKTQLYNKLTNLGFTVTEEDIYSSLTVTVDYVRMQGHRNIFCIGSNELKRQLSEVSNVSNKENRAIDALIIGMDTTVSYNDISDAAEAYFHNKDIEIIACNIDKNYPVENGVLRPGCGAIVAAFETAIERNVDIAIGKPNSYMIKQFCNEHGVSRNEIIVVGDSLDSDIAMANDFGCSSILISKNKKLSLNNTQVIHDIKDICDYY